jgi:hypothetical protein
MPTEPCQAFRSMSDPKFTESGRFDLSFGQVLHRFFETFQKYAFWPKEPPKEYA